MTPIRPLLKDKYSLLCYVITYVRWGISISSSPLDKNGLKVNFGIFIHIFSVKNIFVTHH